MYKQYKSKQECVFNILNLETRNITEISNATGISRSQLTKWKKGVDVNVRIDSIHKLVECLGYKVSFEEDTIIVTNAEDKKNQTTGGQTMKTNLLYEHIELLKDKINSLVKNIDKKDTQIAELKNENKELVKNPIQIEKFESIAYDFTTSVDIKWGLQVKRKIYDVENIAVFARALGIKKQEASKYFDSENFYPMKEHPINTIITKESLNKLEGETSWFMDLVRKGRDLKQILQGLGVLTFLIDYKLNDKVLRTITYSRIVNVLPIITIVNKVQIIRE